MGRILLTGVSLSNCFFRSKGKMGYLTRAVKEPKPIDYLFNAWYAENSKNVSCLL